MERKSSRSQSRRDARQVTGGFLGITDTLGHCGHFSANSHGHGHRHRRRDNEQEERRVSQSRGGERQMAGSRRDHDDNDDDDHDQLMSLLADLLSMEFKKHNIDPDDDETLDLIEAHFKDACIELSRPTTTTITTTTTTSSRYGFNYDGHEYQFKFALNRNQDMGMIGFRVRSSNNSDWGPWSVSKTTFYIEEDQGEGSNDVDSGRVAGKRRSREDDDDVDSRKRRLQGQSRALSSTSQGGRGTNDLGGSISRSSHGGLGRGGGSGGKHRFQDDDYDADYDDEGYGYDDDEEEEERRNLSHEEMGNSERRHLFNDDVDDDADDDNDDDSAIHVPKRQSSSRPSSPNVVRVAKIFHGNQYCGTATELDYQDNVPEGEKLWRVVYDDGDQEDFDKDELKEGIALYEKIHATTDDGSVNSDNDDDFPAGGGYDDDDDEEEEDPLCGRDKSLDYDDDDDDDDDDDGDDNEQAERRVSQYRGGERGIMARSPRDGTGGCGSGSINGRGNVGRSAGSSGRGGSGSGGGRRSTPPNRKTGTAAARSAAAAVTGSPVSRSRSKRQDNDDLAYGSKHNSKRRKLRLDIEDDDEMGNSKSCDLFNNDDADNDEEEEGEEDGDRNRNQKSHFRDRSESRDGQGTHSSGRSGRASGHRSGISSRRISSGGSGGSSQPSRGARSSGRGRGSNGRGIGGGRGSGSRSGLGSRTGSSSGRGSRTGSSSGRGRSGSSGSLQQPPQPPTLEEQDPLEFRGGERQHSRVGGEQQVDEFDECLDGWTSNRKRRMLSMWKPMQGFEVSMETEWTKEQFQWLKGICQESSHLGGAGILQNQDGWELALFNRRCVTAERAASMRRLSQRSGQPQENRKKLERLKTTFRDKVKKENVGCKVCGIEWPPIVMYEYALDNQGVLTNKRALGLTDEAYAKASRKRGMTPGRGTNYRSFLKWVKKRHGLTLEKLSKRIYCEACRGPKIEKLVAKFWDAKA